jgi:uncharacterized membrane protein
MKSQASIAGHPLHPMLVTIPAGGFLLTFILDLVHIVTRDHLWWVATRPVLLVSVIGAAVAAVPGLVDLVTVVPKGRATATGLAHMVLNLVLVGVMAGNAWQRWHVDLGGPIVGTPGFWWSLLGVGILAASGWLGWMMVQTHHVGVLEISEGGEPVEPRVLTGPIHEEVTAH